MISKAAKVGFNPVKKFLSKAKAQIFNISNNYAIGMIAY
jgi:hypothetical protein